MPGRVFDLQVGSYHEHRQVSEYTYDDGCEVVPLCKPASAGPPHFVVVPMHAPVGLRTVRGEAAKSGTPPVMPMPNNTPSGDRLLSFTMSVIAPDTRGSRLDQRTYGGAWEAVYAQGAAPVVEYNMDLVGADEQLPGVARGAVYNQAGSRRPFRLQTGRPPYARLPLDGLMAAFLGALGGILGNAVAGLLAGTLMGVVNTALDASLDAAGRWPGDPLLAGNFREYAVDYRPNYFSDGIIR